MIGKKVIPLLILLLSPAVAYAGDEPTRDPLADVESWSQEIEAALVSSRRSGDLPSVECLERRATPMRTLLGVVRESSGAIAGFRSPGDRELIDRERRKIAVAHSKAAELRTLARSCGGGRTAERDGSVAATLGGPESTMVDAPDVNITYDAPDASPN